MVKNQKIKQYKYIFGPTPSRRIGFTLAVDLIPFKTCNHDCIYCQLGSTTNYTSKRKYYINLNLLKKELKDFVSKRYKIDYITFPGSGEPTLSKDLSKAIKIAKDFGYLTAVFTFGSLLYRKDVLKDIQLADIVLPTLLSAKAKTFQKITKPHPATKFKNYIYGLENLKDNYQGKIFLEVMILKGLNDSNEELLGIKEEIEKIRPDRIHLTSAHRPSLVDKVKTLNYNEMKKAGTIFGKKCEILCDFKKDQKKPYKDDIAKMLLNIIQRRPSSTNEIKKIFGIDKKTLNKVMDQLLEEKKIQTHFCKNQIFLSKTLKNKL